MPFLIIALLGVGAFLLAKNSGAALPGLSAGTTVIAATPENSLWTDSPTDHVSDATVLQPLSGTNTFRALKPGVAKISGGYQVGGIGPVIPVSGTVTVV
jgi:hypothetical protein